jgi:hypothetical protein
MNIEQDRRRLHDTPRAREVAGLSVREADIETTLGLPWVARLFRGLAMLVFALMVLQVLLGATSPDGVSPGLLLAEAVRMMILAALLWAAGALADLFVRSHHDLRAARVLLERIAHRLGDETTERPRDARADLDR